MKVITNDALSLFADRVWRQVVVKSHVLSDENVSKVCEEVSIASKIIL